MKNETVPYQKRVYLTLGKCNQGRAMLRASYLPPAVGEALVALISRGVLMEGESLALPLVSDPTAIDALRGAPGSSAYQLAREQGYGGTLTQWLASLVGAAGASAYDLARQAGYGGTMAQWLTTLVGASGASAYDVAKAAGFSGTQPQWLASLKGADGKDATATQIAAAVAAYMTDHPVTTLVGVATLTVTATAAIALGVHDYLVPLAGVAAGDALHLKPTAALPAGWAIHGAVVTTAGTMRVTVTTPLLALNTSVSIGLQVRRFNT